MVWKAVMKDKSSMDGEEKIEILFDVYIDDKVMYPRLRIVCNPDVKSAEAMMTAVMQRLKDKRELVKSIPDKLEVTLSEKSIEDKPL